MRATILIVVGIAVRSITNILIIRLGFEHLSAEQFGLWVLLQSVVAYLNLSDLGVGQGIMNAQASMAERRDREGAIRVLSSGAAIFAVVASVVWIFGNGLVAASPGLWTSTLLPHKEFQSYFLLLSALSLAVLPFSSFSASLGGLRDLEVRYFWDISLVIAVAVTTGIMLITNQSILAILAAPLAVQLAWYLIPVGLVAIRHSGVSFQFSAISREVVRSLVGSSLFIFLMSLALLTQRYAANLLTGGLVSVEAVAWVHPHVVLFQIFGWTLVDAATRAMLPYVTGIGVRGDEKQLQFITIVAAKVSIVAAVCFSLFIWTLGPALMQVWLKKDVFLGAPIVLFLGFIFVLDSPAAVFTNISIATERHHRRALTNLAYALTGVLFGAAGAWIAPGVSSTEKLVGVFGGFLLASLLFHFVVFPRVMRFDLKISFSVWFREIVLKPVCVFMLLLVLSWLLRGLLGKTSFEVAIEITVSVLAMLCFIVFRMFDQNERRWLGQRLKIPIWRN